MPRRKKNGQSPARVHSGPPEGGSLGYNTGNRGLQGFDGSMANNFTSSTSLSGSDKENIVRSMQEMFSHLDPEVIYIVLSECDFKVENAMDSLLELSNAAEVAAPILSPVSGFELTAAALLSPRHLLEPRQEPDSSGSSRLVSSPTILTEELDLLVDQELETLTTEQCKSAEQYLSPFPQPPLPQQDLPELLQSSLQPGFRGPSVQQQGPVGGLVESISGASSPLDQLSTWEDKVTEAQEPTVDYKHLMTETSVDTPKPPLDLAASGRPSAFQVYKKQDSSEASSGMTGVMSSNTVVGGARSKVNTSIQAPFGYMPSSWNLEAPVFSPHFHGNQGPAFITPVAQTPSGWPNLPRHPSPWLGQGPVSQAPLKPSATIPKSWALPAAPHPPAQHSRLHLEGKVLVLLRGAPGSGKSTLAGALVKHNPGGVRLCTDDFFTSHGRYQFNPTALGEAHEWNHRRAKEAFERGANPIIIDNTNMQGWEMKPYVAMALKHGYKVLFREPDTWWKSKPRELQRRSTHDVPVETIRRMLNGYERFVTVQSIMGSQMPEFKQSILQENRNSQSQSVKPCPDLVGQPRLTEGYKKSDSELFYSLPDVSSVSYSAEVGILEDGTNKSQESLDMTTEKLTENPEVIHEDDEMDLGDLDSELDAHLELNHPGDQRIPDCIVESVMNQDQHEEEEVPVAFSESIGQRVRRERTSRRSGFDRTEPADLVKDTTQSEEKGKREGEEAEGVEADKGTQIALDFVGDWPSEGSLQQRQARTRERHINVNLKEDGLSQEEKKTKGKSGSNGAEFQRLLDLIQTGVAATDISSPYSSSLSMSSGEESVREDEVVGRLEGSNSSRSNSEERENNHRVISSRGELPDCVLDWKGADYCESRESRFDSWQPLTTVNDGCSTTGGNDSGLGNNRTVTGIGDFQSVSQINSLSALAAESLVISRTVEDNNCKDEGGSDKILVEVLTEPDDAGQTDKDSADTRAESDGGRVSEMSLSPVCEGTVEADSSAVSGGSQERKQRQGRRSGKQCKLALTFTQNCPASSPNALEGLNTAATSLNFSRNSIDTDIESSCNTSLNPQPNLDLFSDSKSEARPQPSSSPPLVETGCSTQTEPQDFAFLWRLTHRDSPDDAGVTLCNHPGDTTVLSGDSSRFVPEMSSAISAAVAVHPSGHADVPYHVVHEKGTQVEEREFGATQDRLESLRILSRHFKLVSFDTLEDLYDKCHQDLEWTTNLLLDSGERFFKDDDGVTEMEEYEKDQKISNLCGALGEASETRVYANVFDGHHPEDLFPADKEGTQQINGTAKKLVVNGNDNDVLRVGGAAFLAQNKDHPDETLHLEKAPETKQSLPEAVNEGERCGESEQKVTSEVDIEGGAWGLSFDDSVIIEESRVEIDEEIASMDEVKRLLQAELEEMERQEQKEKAERSLKEGRRKQHLDIQSVELKLPTEVALQLTELFGPVGVDPGSCPSDDCAVQMDLNLAKLLHQKWKETIQEKQRQATLSFHLLQESSLHWGESQGVKTGPGDSSQSACFLISADGYTTPDGHPETRGRIPFMDHWSVSRPHVSLREIIKEEQALQENMEKTRQSRSDLDRRDGATILKETQLYSLFPTIDRHFLQDIFRDHNYSLTETELFLRSLLVEEPVKTVIAPEAPRSDHHRAASKEREKRQKPVESTVLDYQDTEDPEYVDFRAEASLQRKRQIESFEKAAEAFKQGHKEVASFYSQQGHMHGKRMHEANHRAAFQIFQRVNSSLLPRNILDLHGLHVDEALEHLAQVLEDKSTGRGNHSQGGVARIRPAVIDYLTSKHYRFTEPNTGHVLVSLK
ncbi:NEDD4-binding protein 2 isoform X2 [Notolabrus celidotus]|uniref:NEDD4-binding protein 2 isoform X2 n=1 Tax=Notolabrus celidotus TaxID=1203425 RepID=UPI0014901F8F|nr:NEDD4-binding protein 2 isoform X2 [Notolabrus celidotus]